MGMGMPEAGHVLPNADAIGRDNQRERVRTPLSDPRHSAA